jgi:hypothetical protein
MSPMNTIYRRIHEWPDSWEVAGERGTYGHYPSGAEALEAVKAESAQRVERTGESESVVVEWEPMTRIGRLVAKVLAR